MLAIDAVEFLCLQQGGALPNPTASAFPLPVRTAVRFPIRLDVLMQTPDREYKAVTEDISANGLLFVSDELPPVGSSIRFRLNMPAAVMGGTEDVVLECVGRVVRHTEVDGRAMAAAVIDEYSLRSQQ
jgi:hypothetical protein